MDKTHEELVRNILSISADNNLILDEKMRSYLLDILIWFHKNDGSNNINHPLHGDKIKMIKRILVENRYNEEDKETLNKLKEITPWITNKTDDIDIELELTKQLEEHLAAEIKNELDEELRNRIIDR